MLESVLEKAEEKAKSEELRINEIKLGKMEPAWVREKVDRLMRE